MPNLKDLKVRIDSVKSTQKITSAMKMVAAAKLRKAQLAAEEARPYSDKMNTIMQRLADGMNADNGPALLKGSGSDDVVLLVGITSDRGLCGAFNGSIIKSLKETTDRLIREGKTPKLLLIGRKAKSQLSKLYSQYVVSHSLDENVSSSYELAKNVSDFIIESFENNEFDVCKVIYNHFKSAMSQIVTHQQIIPFSSPEAEDNSELPQVLYDYEPDQETILETLIPSNITVQIFHALLESYAGEHGARMTAMDNATRNAGDMIKKLTLTYNRTRQALITKELIEIISGAEAL